MLRLKIFLLVAALAIAAPAQVQVLNRQSPNAATNCLFQIASTPDALACDNDLDRGVPSVCTVKYMNVGTDACTGNFEAVIGPATQGTVDQASTTGITTTCRTVGLTGLPEDPTKPPPFGVTALETAALCDGDGTIAPGALVTMSARVTPSPSFSGNSYVIGAGDSFTTSSTIATGSVLGQFNLANCNLTLSGPSITQSGVPYNLTWTAASSPTTYEIQEATQPDFSDAKTTTNSATQQQFTHTAAGSAATYYYRVRASTCRGAFGPYSTSAIVTVSPAADPTSKSFDIVIPEHANTVIVQQVRVLGLTPNVPFAATTDQKFLTVTPSTGNTGHDGFADLTVSADPSSLLIGANTGTVTVTTSHAKTANGIVLLDNNTTTVPISVTVATPVTQAPKTPPPATTWIIPAVAHAAGIGAQFISDVRLANANSTATNSYQLTYTASNSDGSHAGTQTKISLAPGQTVALNDILHDVFGVATTASSNASGVLEIRALGTPSSGTVASSRTYSVATAGATYGQLVPAVPIDRVATAAAAGSVAQPLILAHAGQTLAQRMNVGIVESLGFPTSGRIRAFNATGQLIAEVPFTLRPFEQQQINSFLARNGITAANAHVEVIVDPPTAGTTSGGVTAYASMLDNNTNDASVVTGIKASSLTASRYVLPGVSELTSSGDHSELRILNTGTSPVDATATFYPEGAGAPVAKTVSLAAGEVKTFDSAVASLFGATGTRGSVVVTTAAAAPLLVTGRTYSAASTGGTFGELQTAVMPTDGVGSTDGEMQIVQAEESNKFRTDLGLAEITGAPATVHVTVFTPDAKVSASTDISLNPNESRTLPSIISSLGLATGNTYNARLSVKVTGGSGRVTAYGSLIDRGSNDPTLLPAQK